VFERLEEAGLPGLYAVEIQETCTSGTRYSRSQKSEVRSQKSEVSYD
ncbi:MAG: 6-carboxytetrahydropterin synthase QueD, partial [Moorea sp. SIO3E2]|nr:6-carboxytetrahydropterin synthase QueD [Moorena sp. SIO3E2]